MIVDRQGRSFVQTLTTTRVAKGKGLLWNNTKPPFLISPEIHGRAHSYFSLFAFVQFTQKTSNRKKGELL